MDDLLTGSREDERTGSVRALGLPGLEARLREQRRLLVDGEPCERERISEDVGLADGGVAIDDLRLLGGIELEERAGLLGPFGGLEIEQQRA